MFKKNKENPGEKHIVTFNIFEESYAGTSYYYIVHIFVDGKYLNSTTVNHQSSKRYSDINRGMTKLIEEEIMLPAFHNSSYAFNRNHFQEKDGTSIIKYSVSIEDKSAYQRLKERFLEADKTTYSKKGIYDSGYSIRNIEETKIYSTCWDASHRDSDEFDKGMKKQSEDLIDFIKEQFGVLIKVTTLPKYKDMKSSLDIGFIYFPYIIVKIVDEKKLELKAKLKKGGILELLNAAIIRNEKEDSEESNDVEDEFLNTINIYEATDRMFRNPKLMKVIKRYESDLLEDFDNYKEFLIKEMIGEHSFCDMNIFMLYKFQKMMPKLYEKMFGNIPFGLLPVTIYKKFKDSELKSVAYNFETPKMI